MTKTRITIEDLAIITKKGFDEVDIKFDSVNKRFDGIDRRLDNVEKRLDGIDMRLDDVETRLEKLEQKIIQLPDKEYLIDKLADLRGDIIILLRREDKRLQFLIDKLRQKNILDDKDIKEIEELKIFAQQI